MTRPIPKYFALAGLLVALALAGCGSLAKGLLHSSSETLKPIGPEPEVSFKALTGSEVPLASFKGKVVLINFWATWCDPCREEIPWLIDLQRKYGDQGFTLLGVAMDDEGASVVNPFVQSQQFDVDGQKMKMNYPIVIGKDSDGEKFGGIFGYPTSILIDKNGQINKRIIGLIDRDQINRQIRQLLQAPATSATTTTAASTPANTPANTNGAPASSNSAPTHSQ
jgi:thiol-disulfide isomerase/thioredoxin